MDATQAAPTATETPAQSAKPEQAQPKKYKVKVDQDELEVDEHELVRGYQRASAADKRFKEAAALYNEAKPYMTAKQKKDINALLDGMDDDQKRDWAENYLSDWLRTQQMDPTERENLELKKKTKQYEEEKTRKEREDTERRQKAEREQISTKAKADLDSEIAEAVKSSGLKPTPRLIARIADEMLSTHLAKAGERLPAGEALKRADKTLRDDLSAVLSEMPIDKMIDYLGKDKINQILKFHADKVREGSPFGKPRQAQPAQSRAEKPMNMSTDNYFAKLDEKFRRQRK